MERDTYGSVGYPTGAGPLRPTPAFRSTAELEAELGEQFRRARLRLELSQEDVARAANVSLTVVRNLEHGRGARLTTVVKIASALGEVDTWLLALAPEATVSPLEVLRAKGLLSERQRAPRRDPLPDLARAASGAGSGEQAEPARNARIAAALDEAAAVADGDGRSKGTGRPRRSPR